MAGRANPLAIDEENTMSEQNAVNQPPTAPAPRACRGRGRLAIIIILVALAAGVAGSFVGTAFGQGPGPWHPGAFMGGPIDPAQADRHVERAIKHLAIEADANADQQAKLVALAKAAVNDLLPLREKAVANRKQGFALFTAATIDRAAVERLRTEQMALADTASRRIAQALGDAAEVLSADQRRTLVERLSSFRGRRHFWHHG